MWVPRRREADGVGPSDLLLFLRVHRAPGEKGAHEPRSIQDLLALDRDAHQLEDLARERLLGQPFDGIGGQWKLSRRNAAKSLTSRRSQAYQGWPREHRVQSRA